MTVVHVVRVIVVLDRLVSAIRAVWSRFSCAWRSMLVVTPP